MISLNISERIAALSILNAFKGNLETMASILEDINQLPVTDEEWEKAGKKETKIDSNVQWTWDDEKGGEKEIELQKPTVEYLTKTIKERDESGDITFQDRALITLKEKL